MNRQQRRLLEKQLGLMKKYQKATNSEKAEIRERRREMGEKLHLQNLENVYNAQQAADEKRQMDFIQNMVAQGFTAEEAKKKLDQNLQAQEQRTQELEERARKRAIRAKVSKNSISK